LRATRHRIVHDGRAHWTWCAFDAIGIPAALGIDATAHTDCPVCRTPLTVALRRGVPENHRAVLWLPGSSGSNLMSDFCARADLYCSREHLEQRIDLDAGRGRVVDVHEGAALGRVSWADVANVDGMRS
jgi:alkylmercury lyase